MSGSEAAGRLRFRLALREPFDGAAVLSFLRSRAIPGVEVVTTEFYARVLRLPHSTGVAVLRPGSDCVACTLEVPDSRDVGVAVQRCRALMDLDADPCAVDSVLRAEPRIAPLIRRSPGLRMPGHVDGFELSVRAVIGQQVSVAGASTTAGRIAAAYGEPVQHELATQYGLTHAFCTPAALAPADPASLGMPRQRGGAVTGLAAAVEAGDFSLDRGADAEGLRRGLQSIHGIGEWTAGYVAMRAAGDPDVFLNTDLVVRRQLAELECGKQQIERWRPWRSYAVMHLWNRAASRGRRWPAA